MQLPDQILHTSGSRLEIQLTRFRRPAVLICHGQDTAPAAFAVNNTVRERYPDAEQVVIASIIDLRAFPKMFQGIVKPELEKAYLQAAGKLPANLDAKDYVILIPDWDGSVTDQLGANGSTRQAVVVVADSNGKVVGSHTGDNLGTVALEFLTKLLD